MCILCVEIPANKLTINEAFRNFREMKSDIDEEHQMKVLKLLYEKRLNEKNSPKNEKNP